MRITFDTQSLELSPAGSSRSYRATLGDRSVGVEILHMESGKLGLLIDGKRVIAYISSENTKRWVTINGQTFVLTKTSGARKGRHGPHHPAGELTAPMPGQIRAVNVSEEEAVIKGQTLLVIEAMKMEIRVQAPMDGVVKKLFVEQGQTVEREQLLIEIA